MNPVLFADGDWVKLLFFAMLFCGWVIKLVIKGVKDEQEPPRRGAPPSRRPQATTATRQSEQPREELDQFLEDLGIRKKEQAARTSSRPPSPPRQEKPRPAPRQKQRQDVSRRQLKSKLQDRRPEEIHSRIEDQHLHPTLGGLGQDAKNTAGRVVAPAAAANSVRPDAALLELFQNNDQLVRTIVVGEVLGKPLSLR